jgi:hypothetical protein
VAVAYHTTPWQVCCPPPAYRQPLGGRHQPCQRGMTCTTSASCPFAGAAPQRRSPRPHVLAQWSCRAGIHQVLAAARCWHAGERLKTLAPTSAGRRTRSVRHGGEHGVSEMPWRLAGSSAEGAASPTARPVVQRVIGPSIDVGRFARPARPLGSGGC